MSAYQKQEIRIRETRELREESRAHVCVRERGEGGGERDRKDLTELEQLVEKSVQ